VPRPDAPTAFALNSGHPRKKADVLVQAAFNPRPYILITEEHLGMIMSLQTKPSILFAPRSLGRRQTRAV
jgi:hypothetical protein